MYVNLIDILILFPVILEKKLVGQLREQYNNHSKINQRLAFLVILHLLSWYNQMWPSWCGQEYVLDLVVINILCIIPWLGLHHFWEKFIIESVSMASPYFIPTPTHVMNSTVDFVCLSDCSVMVLFVFFNFISINFNSAFVF